MWTRNAFPCVYFIFYMLAGAHTILLYHQYIKYAINTRSNTMKYAFMLFCEYNYFFDVFFLYLSFEHYVCGFFTSWHVLVTIMWHKCQCQTVLLQTIMCGQFIPRIIPRFCGQTFSDFFLFTVVLHLIGGAAPC